MSVLGIDPGMEGGLAIRGKDFVVVDPMPVNEKGIDLFKLRKWLKTHEEWITYAFIEEQSVRPRQDPFSGFKTGRGLGRIEALVFASHIPYRIIQPREWSDFFPHGVTEKVDKKLRYRQIKQARKRIVRRIFPTVDLRETERSRTDHEGMTDALLIAEYGYRLRLRG